MATREVPPASPAPAARAEGELPAGARVPAKGEVERVLVVANLEKAPVREFQARLLPWLRSRVGRVTFEGDARELARSRAAMSAERASADLPDLVVVLGGDGAILGAVRAFAENPIPTLGINFGRVGFLASTPAGHWEEALGGILEGEGVLEPRMRLEARVRSPRKGTEAHSVALNDAVVGRGIAQGMLTLGFSVDGKWVTDYRADGLILATPSGSTAHSLSAGGPILFPSMLALVATPICPQGLSYRPLVLHPDSRVELVVKSSSGITTLAVDGQGFYTLRQGDAVEVARHPVAYPLLAWQALDPYRRLRERLGWSGRMAPERASPAPGEDEVHGGVL